MKLNLPLYHAKYFWWGKGVAFRPRKNTDHFYYKMQWKSKSRRRLTVIEQTLPEGVQPIDANLFVKHELEREFTPPRPFQLPWPYSERPLKGTPSDPAYKAKTALVFGRHKRLLEPINLPLYFTNSILEHDLPGPIRQFRDRVKIEDKFIDYCRRRFESVLHHDSALRKLPLDREFPYMDQKPPRVFGTTVNRKEHNLLQTLYDISSTWNSRNFGFNPNVLLQRVSNPNCVVSLDRDQKFVLLDLECDFMTLLSPVNNVVSGSSSSSSTLKQHLFDPDYMENARNKQLKSIHPISWQVGFDSKNFYPDDLEFKIPEKSAIQTICLSNNSVRMLNDEDYQGRGIMYCYGYALQQAKMTSGHHHRSSPIIIQCLYTSPKQFKIGFVLFQLNGDDMNGDHNQIRNQVWLSQPKSILDETREALMDLCTLQSFRLN